MVRISSLGTKPSDGKWHEGPYIIKMKILCEKICGICPWKSAQIANLSLLSWKVIGQGTEGGLGGRPESPFPSQGWVIFLLSANLHLLNIQNNFGLNQIIQWVRVKS